MNRLASPLCNVFWEPVWITVVGTGLDVLEPFWISFVGTSLDLNCVNTLGFILSNNVWFCVVQIQITSHRLLDQSQAGVHRGKRHIPPHFGLFGAIHVPYPKGLKC